MDSKIRSLTTVKVIVRFKGYHLQLTNHKVKVKLKKDDCGHGKRYKHKNNH